VTRLRHLAGLLVIAALLVLLVRWFGPTSASGFATPQECVAAYAKASLEGDVAGYRRCLTVDRRAESERRFPDSAKLAEELRSSMAEVKSWVQNGDSEAEESGARVAVDVVRPEGTRRIVFHLERGPRGWLIDRVDEPQEVHTPIRHGTHVSAVPEEKAVQGRK
jgi:hypothetical protein